MITTPPPNLAEDNKRDLMRWREKVKSIKAAFGWETWTKEGTSCCVPVTEIKPTTIPPRDLPWRAKSQKDVSHWPVAKVHNGTVKEWNYLGSGTWKPVLDQRKMDLIGRTGKYDPCKPYSREDLFRG